MTKLLSLLLCAAMVSTSVCAFADEPAPAVSSDDGFEVIYPEGEAPDSPEPESVTPAGTSDISPESYPSYLLSNKVTLQININQTPRIRESTARFELYTETGTLLSIQEAAVTRDTDELNITFPVPQYVMGTHYKLKLASGLSDIKYYDDIFSPGEEITFSTYRYEDENGDAHNSEGIIVSATPLYEKGASVKYDGVPLNLSPEPLVLDGVTMIPIRALAEYIGFTVTYNEDYNVEILSLGSNRIYFNVGTAYTTAFGTDLYAKHPTANINGTIYVSLRTFAEIIGSTLDVYDAGTAYIINMTSSPYVNNYFTGISVNRWGISSRTDYMVWVSLSEYKVRVYQGKQYQWKPIYECTCTIGAPSTPTITGSYEYQYTDRWNYDGYYVGPCLVFYGGYALHSVLLNYDGTEYDGRVGMQLSHGCVRMKKKDIDWIYQTIPLHTRIFLTQ